MTVSYTKLPSIKHLFDDRFEELENKYVRSTRFEEIITGTSGAVTITGTQEIVLNDFGGGTDAVISTFENGYPTFENATDTNGVLIATTFDAVGNYVLSGTPSSYPVSIVYRVREKFIDFDESDTNLIGEYDLEDSSVRASGTDLNPGTLIDKVVSIEENIDIEVLNLGGDEQLRLTVSPEFVQNNFDKVLTGYTDVHILTDNFGSVLTEE